MVQNVGIKAGSNINTNTDSQLKLTSKFSSLKLYKWGDTSITTNGSGVGSVEIPHDLDYTPIVVVLRKRTAQYPFLSSTTYSNTFSRLTFNPYFAGGELDFIYYADDEKLRIENVNTGIGSGGVLVAPSPSTTYHFRYMIFVDKSESFSDHSNIALTNDYGFKVSQQDVDVLTGEEYEMAFSSKYKSLQYYENHILSSSLTLPAQWASINSSNSRIEAATYVDFNHNLGYAPYFLVFSTHPSYSLGSSLFLEPFRYYSNGYFAYKGIESVTGWADSQRVRVTFSRTSDASGDVSPVTPYGEEFTSKTVQIKVVIFAESLTAQGSPGA